MRDSSPLALIASDWGSTRLQDVCEFITKGTTPTTLGFEWAEAGVPFLRSECVGDGSFNATGVAYISPEAHAALSRSVIHPGDILVTITGYVGRACQYPGSMPEGNINQHIARVRVGDTRRVDPTYLLQVLSSREYRSYFERIVTGQAYPQISLQQVRETVIPLPRLAEQRRIAAVLLSVENCIDKTQLVLDQLGLVRKALRSDLLTGKTRVHGSLEATE